MPSDLRGDLIAAVTSGPYAGELTAAFWLIATIAGYFLSKALYRRLPRWWSSPLVMTPAVLLALAIGLHAGYRDYMGGAHWLSLMVGPATVAFALPIYEQRALIRRYWPVLAIGVTAGSTIAMTSAWMLASLMDLSSDLRLSLLARSVTTPFAMAVSHDVGGVPDLTAVFAIVTGVCGAAMGQVILRWLPLRSALARGAVFGMAAHGAGVAKAREIGTEEGSVAGLVMVMAGLLNVAAAPVLAYCLR